MTTNTKEPTSLSGKEEMISNGYKLLACKLTQGGFSSQRLFTVTDAAGFDRMFAGYYEHFFDENRKPLDVNTPAPDKTIDGYTKCRVLKVREDGETVIVDVPSSDAVVVKIADLIEL